jgi:tetratricopeptide (TPR) repeat protein
LSRFDVEIDPVKDTAAFYTPSRCSAGVVDWLHSDLAQVAVKIDSGVNLMTVPVVLDGQTIDALIDTGAVETYISRDVANRLFGADSADGVLSMHRRQFHSLRLGGLDFPDPWLVVTPISARGPQMILGMHQLRGLHLFFAYSRRILYATTARGDIAARLAAAPANASAGGLHNPTAMIDARDHLMTAEEALKRKDFAAAIAAADAAVQSDPDYVQGYLERGDLYRRQGARDRAVDDMQHAVRLDPVNFAGILSLSELYLDAGDIVRAVAEADKGVELAPRDSVSYAVRAEAYAAQGLMNRALSDAITAIRLEPDQVAGYLSRSHIHELSGDYERAFDFADKAVAVDPHSALALNARCWNGALLGRLDVALRDCDEAVALLPYSPEILDSRGFVHMKAGRTDRAIADFSAALAINPYLATSLYGRALAQRQNGQTAAADADIAAAVAADPDIAKHFGR